MAYGEDAPAIFDESIPLPQDPDNPNPNSAEQVDRAIWTRVVSMHKLMVSAPCHFFAEPVKKGKRTCEGLPDETREPLMNGHSPEDWSRAYWLLNCRIRQSSRQRADSMGRQRNEGPLAPGMLT